MKRALAALATLLVFTIAGLAYRTVDACGDWQERYKRFLFIEMMKNSPIIYTPPMIEEIVGERPLGCDTPGRTISNEDFHRYQKEVDSDEFQDETRSAFRRTKGFQDL